MKGDPFPIVVRWTGWTGIVFMTVVWLLTGRVSAELISAFGGLIAFSEGVAAYREIGGAK